MGLLISVISGFALALVAPWLHRTTRGATGWLLALLPLGLTGYLAACATRVVAGQAIGASYPWVATLGVSFSLRLDALSLLFALLICGIGALILIYAGGYLAGHPRLGRFYAYLLLFLASMLGVVLADNAVTLFVFWELTSFSSYLLIGFERERVAARSAALQALLVTGLGGLALLAGLILLGQLAGSLEISQLLAAGEAVRGSRLYLPILLLVLAGAFTKSAQFPFHFWLPNAMEAPTPVSAYLHSATMVKAGVYLLARLQPVLGGTPEWLLLVTAGGAATMFVGACLAMKHTDLKRILAYTTVSALGILTLLLGVGSAAAAGAAMLFLLAHALYKGALFLVAGALDHETGTRDAEQLGGLRALMPLTAAAAALAALSMAGVPLLAGFLAKEQFYESVAAAPWLLRVSVLSSMLLGAMAILAGLKPFLGARLPTPKAPHEAPPSLWLGPALLAALGLLVGLVPGSTVGGLVSAAGSAVSAQALSVELKPWHGFTPLLAWSAVTLAGSLGFYLARAPLRRWLMGLAPAAGVGPERAYEAALAGANALARAQTRLLQSGYLRYYLITIIGTTVGLASYVLWTRGARAPSPDWSDVRFYELGVALLTLAAAWTAVRSTSRLGAIAALGVVGYGVALIYVLFGAPDLAMTQFLVETLTVILFVLVFYHLPRFSVLTRTPARLRDAAVALLLGGFVGALVLAATSVPGASRLTPYFLEQSVPAAQGRNVVNVILVDFRALDTLGEITVLAVAGIGVYALLKLRLGERKQP